MKLESLKSSKFEAFKGSEIVNAMSIKGGACTQTESGGVINDTYNPDWSKGSRNTQTNEERDFGPLNDKRCEIGSHQPSAS